MCSSHALMYQCWPSGYSHLPHCLQTTHILPCGSEGQHWHGVGVEGLLELGRQQNPVSGTGKAPSSDTSQHQGSSGQGPSFPGLISPVLPDPQTHRLSQSFRLPVLSHSGEKPPGSWMPAPAHSSRLGNEKPAPCPHTQTAPHGGLPLPTQHQQ